MIQMSLQTTPWALLGAFPLPPVQLWLILGSLFHYTPDEEIMTKNEVSQQMILQINSPLSTDHAITSGSIEQAFHIIGMRHNIAYACILMNMLLRFSTALNMCFENQFEAVTTMLVHQYISVEYNSLAAFQFQNTCCQIVVTLCVLKLTCVTLPLTLISCNISSPNTVLR